jgi:hypothetical protein
MYVLPVVAVYEIASIVGLASVPEYICGPKISRIKVSPPFVSETWYPPPNPLLKKAIGVGAKLTVLAPNTRVAGTDTRGAAPELKLTGTGVSETVKVKLNNVLGAVKVVRGVDASNVPVVVYVIGPAWANPDNKRPAKRSLCLI